MAGDGGDALFVGAGCGTFVGMPYVIPKGTHVLVRKAGDWRAKWRSHVTRRELSFAGPRSRLKRDLVFVAGDWLVQVPLDEVKPRSA